jgi:hypothetical protein
MHEKFSATGHFGTGQDLAFLAKVQNLSELGSSLHRHYPGSCNELNFRIEHALCKVNTMVTTTNVRPFQVGHSLTLCI